MKRMLPASLLLSLLSALAVQARAQDASRAAAAEGYVSPPQFAGSGNFRFRYPAELIVLQDYVYREAGVDGPRHVVVLRHKDAQPGDLRSIEINALRSFRQRMTCADYIVCKAAAGVVIGTDSQDAVFLRAFELVTSSFEAR